MKKIMITVLVALAGVALAQLPASMTALGIGLPNGSYRMGQDQCAINSATMAAELGTSKFECIVNTSTYSLTYRHQHVLLQSARYELVREMQLTDQIVYQIWEHRDSGVPVFLTHVFDTEGIFVGTTFYWD